MGREKETEQIISCDNMSSYTIIAVFANVESLKDFNGAMWGL